MAASELLMCSNPQATHVPERYGSLYVCNCSGYDLCCPIVVLTESARCIYSLRLVEFAKSTLFKVNTIYDPRRKGPRDCVDIELNYSQLTAKNPRGISRFL